MKKTTAIRAVILLGATALSPFAAQAGSLNGWNKGNVDVGPEVTGTDAGASVVYDRLLPDVNAESNGQIYYAAPEADSPGLEVLNGVYTAGGNTFDGCIIASSDAVCDGPFQSGKRFKQQFTSAGEMDLVFDVDTMTPEATVYQVFHRIVNLTGQKIRDFTVELGFGIGENFVRSTDGDGLGFNKTIELGPNDLSAFSQYPFGLFGSLAQPNPNPNYQIGGFFDTDSRSGYDLIDGEDFLESDGFYGNYGTLFGDWLAQDMVPEGLFWDWDGAGSADPLLMAWATNDQWEVRRGVAPGTVGPIEVTDIISLDPSQWGYFALGDIAGVEAFLQGLTVGSGFIEDLANLNMNYAIDIGAGDPGFDQFTLRVNVTAVPLPLSAPLLVAGLGALAALRRSRRV